MRFAVVDASPLINLAHLDLARELALFFDRVYVPRAVQEEVNKKGRFRCRLKKLYSTGYFTRCVAADTFQVQLLQAELHKGEAEALIQAQEKNALYFIGDARRARAIAVRMGRTSVGTLRILARLSLEKRAPELPNLRTPIVAAWQVANLTNADHMGTPGNLVDDSVGKELAPWLGGSQEQMLAEII